MPDLAYLNGDIMPIEKATVPIEDRGYQFGDGVYEYIASYAGRLFMLGAHLDRLERSMGGLDFPPIPRPGIKTAIVDLFERAGYDRAGIYIQITRGVAPRNHAFDPTLSPQVVMTIREINALPENLHRDGITAITVRDIRWGRCDIKTIQLLANSLAKQKALSEGHSDAIFISDQDVVREGTSSNLFIIKGGQLITHPLTPNILPGITRMAIIDICRETGLKIDESFFTTDALYHADEVFLTGTVTEVLPVTQIDGRCIGDGNVGPLTRKLYDGLRQKALAGA
ncbi:amino acid aminotransferase [Desulfosarcina ovata subsp. sediminis]|uniref:Amino acid aminotransferase n=1 Tax=Desulfosarcina ovata subsp. sediminis TaxID=885957 RepID=A0A5K8A002_9BACT|nr:D-amino acid aminotransferase [Desulfosarcina ovata]BBO85670.1 amino acid aminotransferase [Desulfosarcina ovata subsp. sediminis]